MPKDDAAPSQPMYSFTAEQFQALADLINGSRPSMADQLELIKAQAVANAEANRAALRPENAAHPGLSVFSRPGGEVLNPKSPTGAFPYRFTWAGTPVDYDTTNPAEYEGLIGLSVGLYRCTRQDGTSFPVTITTRASEATGQIEQMDIAFATRGQLKNGLPPMTLMCREMIEQRAAKTKVA